MSNFTPMDADSYAKLIRTPFEMLDRGDKAGFEAAAEVVRAYHEQIAAYMERKRAGKDVQ